MDDFEGDHIIWQPQPGPQTHLLTCPVFDIFFGGARGGGKTDGMLGEWAQHSHLYGKDAVGVFFRRQQTQLAEVIARAKELFMQLGGKYNENKNRLTMPSGARLYFKHLERDSDAELYQGHSYTRVYIEELTNFPSSAPVDKLLGTLRSRAGVPCGFRATGNPGGPGHNWVFDRYIKPNPTGYKVFTETATIKGKSVSIDRVFIPSKITDNALLLDNDPAYLIRLAKTGSEALVKAWLDGDWSIIDGAFFDEWRADIHILDTDFWKPRIPSYALKFRSFDWGSAKPFSVGWYAVSDGTWGLPEGAMVKYREWYGASGPNKGLKMLAQSVGQGIVELEKGESIAYGVADPAIFIQDGGPSIAEEMAKVGCLWRKADNRRVAGWEEMHRRLKGPVDDVSNLQETVEHSKPLLYFLDCCYDSIRTIPTLQHDSQKLEDLDTDGEDHSADETRYAVMSRPFVKKAPAVVDTTLRGVESLPIAELIKQRTRARLAQEREML